MRRFDARSRRYSTARWRAPVGTGNIAGVAGGHRPSAGPGAVIHGCGATGTLWAVHQALPRSRWPIPFPVSERNAAGEWVGACPDVLYLKHGLRQALRSYFWLCCTSLFGVLNGAFGTPLRAILLQPGIHTIVGWQSITVPCWSITLSAIGAHLSPHCEPLVWCASSEWVDHAWSRHGVAGPASQAYWQSVSERASCPLWQLLFTSCWQVGVVVLNLSHVFPLVPAVKLIFGRAFKTADPAAFTGGNLSRQPSVLISMQKGRFHPARILLHRMPGLGSRAPYAHASLPSLK